MLSIRSKLFGIWNFFLIYNIFNSYPLLANLSLNDRMIRETLLSSNTYAELQSVANRHNIVVLENLEKIPKVMGGDQILLLSANKKDPEIRYWQLIKVFDDRAAYKNLPMRLAVIMGSFSVVDGLLGMLYWRGKFANPLSLLLNTGFSTLGAYLTGLVAREVLVRMLDHNTTSIVILRGRVRG